MAPTLLWYLAASSGMAMASFSSWWFVWRHEDTTTKMDERTLFDQAFWFSFSYLMPFLPSLFALLGPLGIDKIHQNFARITTAILVLLMAVIMTGISLSTLAWMRKDKSDEDRHVSSEINHHLLGREERRHLYWTTGLSGLVALLWWIILIL
ncbi:MAG TPA: hypothetical protein EYG04_07875 [Candidatus Poseidoniales archaeon]|nr:hypothetical protein [Candidatus Poseidoniales archaeon]